MSPADKYVPLEIGPTEDEARLRIRWKDGVSSEYVPRQLRLLCPCAGCVDEMTGVRTLSPEQVDDSVYPPAIHYVGKYALQFVWSDGHSTGLYTFQLLRATSEAARDDERAGCGGGRAGAEALTDIQPVSASQRVQATSPGLDDVVAPTVAVVALP